MLVVHPEEAIAGRKKEEKHAPILE